MPIAVGRDVRLNFAPGRAHATYAGAASAQGFAADLQARSSERLSAVLGIHVRAPDLSSMGFELAANWELASKGGLGASWRAPAGRSAHANDPVARDLHGHAIWINPETSRDQAYNAAASGGPVRHQ
jgi:hypothetical protein